MNRKNRSIFVSVLSLFALLLIAQYAGADESPTNSPARHLHDEGKPMPLSLHAQPNALAAGSGIVDVRFSVRMIGKKHTATVYLRRTGAQESIAMNDQGVDGDLVAKDRIFGANVSIDTAKLQPDTCELYVVFTRIGSDEVITPATKLCVSSFPVGIAASDTAHPLLLPDGSKAVADELIIIVKQNTSADAIRRLAASINATVVGSNLTHNMYQLKLPAPVSASRMIELLEQMATHAEVEGASPSGIAGFSSADSYFSNQHGLQLVRPQDVWDAGIIGSGVATGQGVTVTVLDSGINRLHPDFGTVGNCQLAENDCGSPSTDIAANSHGTSMAGIIAAKTNNTKGVAGVAYGSKVHSIALGTAPGGVLAVTLPQMIDAFDGSSTGTAASLGNSAKGYTALHPEASVINASLSGGPFGFAYNVTLTSLCAAIQNTVMDAGVPVAIVVNAAGNNGNLDLLGSYNETFYPARCNNHASLINKELFITVANSASVVTPDCGNVAVDARCGASIDGTMQGSNYGSWVDITAPGSAILAPTTTCPAAPAICLTDTDGSKYAARTGTSDSAPFVSGAAAILISCGVPLNLIESTLRNSATVTVPFPGGSSAPRLDIYLALQSLNQKPTALAITNTFLANNLNTSAGAVVGTLSKTDPDTCDKWSYSTAGGVDSALFSFGGANNDRLILTAGVLNSAVKSSYSVTVRVTDFFGKTADLPVTVTVNGAGTPPTPPPATSGGGGGGGGCSVMPAGTEPDASLILAVLVLLGYGLRRRISRRRG